MNLSEHHVNGAAAFVFHLSNNQAQFPPLFIRRHDSGEKQETAFLPEFLNHLPTSNETEMLLAHSYVWMKKIHEWLYIELKCSNPKHIFGLCLMQPAVCCGPVGNYEARCEADSETSGETNGETNKTVVRQVVKWVMRWAVKQMISEMYLWFKTVISFLVNEHFGWGH